MYKLTIAWKYLKEKLHYRVKKSFSLGVSFCSQSLPRLWQCAWLSPSNLMEPSLATIFIHSFKHLWRLESNLWHRKFYFYKMTYFLVINICLGYVLGHLPLQNNQRRKSGFCLWFKNLGCLRINCQPGPYAVSSHGGKSKGNQMRAKDRAGQTGLHYSNLESLNPSPQQGIYPS